ncbi:MAG: hypothetical protein M1817_004851 [Caeruleum heppii]|nr:MAG: hypothetical protein M1817_004851 [Caeruleum heppii]
MADALATPRSTPTAEPTQPPPPPSRSANPTPQPPDHPSKPPSTAATSRQPSQPAETPIPTPSLSSTITTLASQTSDPASATTLLTNLWSSLPTTPSTSPADFLARHPAPTGAAFHETRRLHTLWLTTLSTRLTQLAALAAQRQEKLLEMDTLTGARTRWRALRPRTAKIWAEQNPRRVMAQDERVLRLEKLCGQKGFQGFPALRNVRAGLEGRVKAMAGEDMLMDGEGLELLGDVARGLKERDGVEDGDGSKGG